MPGYDPNRIEDLEERLAVIPASRGDAAVFELEMLADLYVQADSYVPALETIDRLLSLPEARSLSTVRRAALECKAIACRLAKGDGHAALAQCREILALESEIPSLLLRARLQLSCAEALLQLGRLDEASEHGSRGLQLADESGELVVSARALVVLGVLAYRRGDLDLARDHYEQALALYRRVGDEASTASVHNNLGLVHKNLCAWEAASAHLLAALETYQKNGRFAKTAFALLNLGIVYQKSGDWTRAAGCYGQARQIFAQVGDELHLAGAAIGLGNVARLERRFAEAEGHLLGALERSRAQGAQREEALSLEFLGELDFDRGRTDRALVRYQEALVLAERIAPEGDLVVELERRRAEALCAAGRLDEAAAACERARRLAGTTQDRLEHALAHRAAGSIALARGRTDEAHAAFKLALVLVSECRERHELGRTLLELARVTRDPLEARRLYYRASASFGELSTSYWLETTEGELERLFGPAPDPAPARPASLLGRRHRAPSLVACSPAMRRIETLARRAASTELSVLITGETGTGKELIARTIHSLSPRADRPFLAVNCGALRADLALSQLFGHRKGAFTGAHAEGVGLVEAAHGGTLFLDEVGELPLDVQVTLLRFLESGEYLRLGETQVRRADVRMIAATNRALRGAVDEKLFRPDLLFRLNEIEIRVPALRERADDIVPLGRHFLAFYGGLDGPRLAPDAESVLGSYPWPGNVRELENVMKRVAALHAGVGEVDAEGLLPFLSTNGPRPAVNGARSDADERDRSAILAALVEARGNKSRVAEILGVSRKTLYARLKRLQIEPS